MAALKIAGIKRAEAFSPNRVGDDTAIFNAVCDNLRNRGCEVEVFSEEQFIGSGRKPEVVIGMYRQRPTLMKLQKLEDSGSLVVNSAYGVENCSRERMTRLLLSNGIPYPESLILEIGETSREALERAGFEACWIKCADPDPQRKEEAIFCANTEEAAGALRQYGDHGISRVVINRHIEGEWIKFYGVAGSPFFHWYFPSGNSACTPAMKKNIDLRLREIGGAAARALGVTVYGGDCILTPEDCLVVVDLNDWPSFAPCRQEAAHHIADKILDSIRSKSDSE